MLLAVKTGHEAPPYALHAKGVIIVVILLHGTRSAFKTGELSTRMLNVKLVEGLKDAIVAVLSEGTWKSIEDDHLKVGLAWRPDLEPGSGKPRYVERVLKDFSDADLVSLGQRCLETFPERSRISIQDSLWRLEANGVVKISPITRQAIAASLDGRAVNGQHESLADFFESFWNRPSDDRFRYENGTLYQQRSQVDIRSFAIKHHIDPCTHREMLDTCQFMSWPDKRVFLFLERLVHPEVRRGVEQREWVGMVNKIIKVDGFQLLEVHRLSGHPIFKVQRMKGGVNGKPKNLIFGSTGEKPELGLVDAINNDIVILKNKELCLIYDEPIEDEGLSWSRLVEWWAKMHAGDPKDPEVRKALGKRLNASLGSEPEQILFSTYFCEYKQPLGAKLPALIPQVYLHYDPITVRQLKRRGEKKRFQIQRMDFLLLLPSRVRVVIEIDGQQHYSSKDGKPCPQLYAEMVAGDRLLRLAGYEVYRFGGDEFSDTRPKSVRCQLSLRSGRQLLFPIIQGLCSMSGRNFWEGGVKGWTR